MWRQFKTRIRKRALYNFRPKLETERFNTQTTICVATELDQMLKKVFKFKEFTRFEDISRTANFCIII
jgi:hypothetical protein